LFHIAAHCIFSKFSQLDSQLCRNSAPSASTKQNCSSLRDERQFLWQLFSPTPTSPPPPGTATVTVGSAKQRRFCRYCPKNPDPVDCGAFHPRHPNNPNLPAVNSAPLPFTWKRFDFMNLIRRISRVPGGHKNNHNNISARYGFITSRNGRKSSDGGGKGRRGCGPKSLKIKFDIYISTVEDGLKRHRFYEISTIQKS
jgi:hypothetical protein